MMCGSGDVGIGGSTAGRPFDSPPHIDQMLRDQVEIRQGGGWDRLLVLPRDFDQPADAVQVLRGKR